MQTSAQRHRTKYIVFWLPCLSKDVLCHSILLSATEKNGTERNGTEQNGLELKNRLLNFHGTLMTNNLLNLFLFAWLSMTKMKPLHVEFCLETQNKKHRIFDCLASTCQPSTLSFCIIIMNGPERNRKTDRHLWKKSDVHVQRSIIPFCRRPKRQRLNSSEFSTVMEQF